MVGKCNVSMYSRCVIYIQLVVDFESVVICLIIVLVVVVVIWGKILFFVVINYMC